MSSRRNTGRRQSAIYAILPGIRLAPGGAAEVGNKAWNLMQLVAAGLPVPPAFVLPTSWCGIDRQNGAGSQRMRTALVEGLSRLEAATGFGFGSARRPLLVSVRSGAPISMPGMMATVLDIGLNDETVGGLVRLTGNPRLAWDSYRRLIQGYAEVVDGVNGAEFDALTQHALAREGVASEHRLDHRALRSLAEGMLIHYRSATGAPFPQSPMDQLAGAVDAVFRSWDASKAVEYRRLHAIDGKIGTAVAVQTMVFGNAGGTSGAGVGFTRDPATGENAPYLDFQFNGQGEDVVAGRQRLDDVERLRRTLPAIWNQLKDIQHELETVFGDVQDFEFTVQEGRLFLLQTRSAKRTAWAAVKIAVDLVEEGLIDEARAFELLDGVDLAKVSRQRIKDGALRPLATAVSAGIGVATGRMALDSAAAQRMAQSGEPTILVRRDTTTDDIVGMNEATGILTTLGGRTSHAAVVARQLGKLCLVGCRALSIDLDRRTCRIGNTELAEGDFLSLDGDSGGVFLGRIEMETYRPDRELATIARWNAMGSSC
jgi:pyruvate,orthophosphate dikinase